MKLQYGGRKIMKKALPALLVFSFLLAGCNKSLPSLFSEGEPVDETQFLPVEIPEATPVEEEVIDPPAYKYVTNSPELSYSITDASYSNVGLIIGKNACDRVGFFSLLHGKYIIEPQFVEKWLKKWVYTEKLDGLGYLIKTKYEDEFMVVDSFGNKLLDRDFCDYTLVHPNGNYYLAFRFDNEDEDYDQIFQYSPNGEVREVFEIEEELPEEEEAFEYQGPKIGTVLNEGRYLLDDYGFPGYSIYKSDAGLINVYEGDKLLRTIYVDLETYHFCGFIGDKMVFQRAIQLADDAADYSFSQDGKKYELNTLLVSFETGEKEMKDIGNVISDIIRLKKIDGSTTQYSYVVCQNIDEQKVLSDHEAYIVDGEFKKCKDVSGSSLDAFIKLKNGNYYNAITNYLYDANMKVITNLKSITPTYNKRFDAFEGTYTINNHEYQGLVSNVGAVSIEFKYDKLLFNSSDSKKYVIGTRDEDIYRVQVGKKTETKLGTFQNELNELAENLFESSEGNYFTTESDLFTHDETYTSMQYAHYTYFGEHEVWFVGDYIPYADPIDMKGGAIYDEFFNPTFTSNGLEGLEYLKDGLSESEPAALSLGFNKLHAIWPHTGSTQCATYGEFKPTVSGEYSIYLDSEVSVANTHINGEDVTIDNEVSYDYEDGDHHHFFTKAATVKLVGNQSATFNFVYNIDDASDQQQVYGAYIIKEVGSNYKHPLYVETTGNNQTITLEPSDGSKSQNYFISVHSNVARRYTLSSNQIEFVKVNQRDITSSGIYIPEGFTRVFNVNLRNLVTSAVTLTLTATQESNNPGYSEDYPMMLAYGSSSETVAFTSTEVYLAFMPQFAGVYRYSVNFTASDSIYYAAGVVDKLGNVTPIEPAKSNSNVQIEDGGYLLITAYTQGNQNATLTLTYQSISAVQYRAFENQLHGAAGNVSPGNRVLYFTMYAPETPFDAGYEFSYTNSNTQARPIEYYNVVSGKFVKIASGEIVPESAVSNDEILFRAFPTSTSYVPLNLTPVIGDPATVSFDSTNICGFSGYINQEWKLFKYTNNTTDFQDIEFEITSCDDGLYVASTIEDNPHLTTDVMGYYMNSWSSSELYSVDPGKTLLIAVRSYFNLNTCQLEFRLVVQDE